MVPTYRPCVQDLPPRTGTLRSRRSSTRSPCSPCSSSSSPPSPCWSSPPAGWRTSWASTCWILCCQLDRYPINRVWQCPPVLTIFILSVPGMDSWTFWGTVVTDRLKENWQKSNESGINLFLVFRTWRRQSWSFSLPAMLLTLKVWWKIWRWQSKRMIFAGFDGKCKRYQNANKEHSQCRYRQPSSRSDYHHSSALLLRSPTTHPQPLYDTVLNICVFWTDREEFGCFEEGADYKKVKVSALFKMSSPLIT